MGSLLTLPSPGVFVKQRASWIPLPVCDLQGNGRPATLGAQRPDQVERIIRANDSACGAATPSRLYSLFTAALCSH
jgi:hypothetical protein